VRVETACFGNNKLGLIEAGDMIVFVALFITENYSAVIAYPCVGREFIILMASTEIENAIFSQRAGKTKDCQGLSEASDLY
jgi:hypothetical protein